MPRATKIFRRGRSQMVRLPAAYRFEGTKVDVRRDPISEDVILSQKPLAWLEFFELTKTLKVRDRFPSNRDDPPPQKRKIF
jgi:antitoxin VapB